MSLAKSEKLWQRLANGQLIYAAVGGLCVLIWAIIVGWPGPMTAVSYDQERLDTAIPAPSPGNPIQFIFVPDHDGLNSIEVVIVNFRPGDPAESGPATLSLFDESGTTLASRTIVSATPHNTNFRLDFAPINNSSQQTLTLTLTGQSGGHISLWGYSLNVWPESQLSGGGQAETLRAVTRYAFQASSIPAVLGELLGRFWSPILVALLYIPLPGALFFTLWQSNRRDSADPIVRLALVFGIGIVIWPLLWQWLTVIGLSFSAPILWTIVGLGWIVVGVQYYRTENKQLMLTSQYWRFLTFLVGVFLLRLIAIRDMAFLPWVDSSRHALITAIMRDSGQFLTSYEPYLPVSWSGYHYGLHTLSAGIALMLGDSVSLPDQLLPLMQLLSVLTTLTVFAGAVLLTGRRSVGWIAAFLLSLPFLFPAYYTTWGRLTQISGMIILPLIAGLMAQSYDSNKDVKAPFQYVVICTLLLSGLFLLHARVFFYFVPFGLIIGGYQLFCWIRSKRKLDGLLFGAVGQTVTIALSAGIMVLPRIWRLVNETTYTGLGVVNSPDQPLLSFPIGYARAGWEPWFWLLASGGVIVAIVAMFFVGKVGIRENVEPDQPQARLINAIVLLASWLALLYLMTAGPALHPSWPILLPQSSVNSAYIAAFAAQAILIGAGTVLFYQTISQLNRLAGLITIAMIGAGLMGGALFGAHNQVVILNRSTVLGKQADLAAIDWINENTDPNAKIANNSWLWLNGTWAGTDGAAWLTPMTGRITGTPPIDHIYNSRVFGLTSAFNDTAKDVANWADPNTIDLLRQNRFTHIFTGVSDGSAGVDYDPAELLQNPAVKLVFSADGVYVFEILAP
ncbi:MAG: hypothetical protein AB8G95_04385 [Anaerolineae bacterium]